MIPKLKCKTKTIFGWPLSGGEAVPQQGAASSAAAPQQEAPEFANKCVGVSASGDFWLASDDTTYPAKSRFSRRLFLDDDGNPEDPAVAIESGSLVTRLFSDSEDDLPLDSSRKSCSCSSIVGAMLPSPADSISSSFFEDVF